MWKCERCNRKLRDVDPICYNCDIPHPPPDPRPLWRTWWDEMIIVPLQTLGRFRWRHLL